VARVSAVIPLSLAAAWERGGTAPPRAASPRQVEQRFQVEAHQPTVLLSALISRRQRIISSW
jgi:hypothetical protein